MSTDGQGEPLFRCEFVADPDEVADIVMSSGAAGPKIRASLTFAVLEVVFGLGALAGGLATSRPVVAFVGLITFSLGALGVYGCSNRGLRRRYAKVYANFPSAGEDTVVEVFVDRVIHATSSARGEWTWSHYESAWVSEEIGVMLSSASGRAVLTIPAHALDVDEWKSLCATVRSKLPAA